MAGDIQTANILRGVLFSAAVCGLVFVLGLYPIDPSTGELLSVGPALLPLVVLATVLATVLIPADAAFVET